MTGRPTKPTDAGAREGTRGQAFTLEAIVAAVVVLGGLLFALQVSGVTSLTGSTAGADAVAQQEAVAGGVLDAAVADGSVRPTLLYWDADDGTFYNVSEVDEAYYTVGPPTAFGGLLNASLDEADLAYNVDLVYGAANGSLERHALVRNGVPSDDAATATRTVTLYDDDRLRYANGTVSDATLANASYVVGDRYPGDTVYAVVRVEVTVWSV